MPTYEYKCSACGHAFERFHSMSAAPVKKCPECGKSKVKRLLGTGAGLIFKGSGFYITDYRSDAYQQAAKSDAPAAGGSDSKSEGAKTESPADAKPAAGEKAKSSSSDAKPAAAAKGESSAKPSSAKPSSPKSSSKKK
jgi:putative FmdB family regulatory protein